MSLNKRMLSPPSKQARITNERSAGDLRHLVETTARLTLSNTAAIRQLRSVAVRIALLPSNSYVVSAGKTASQAWSVDPNREARGLPFVNVFLAICKALAHCSDTSPTDKQLVQSVLDRPLHEIIGSLKACRLSKCFKQDWTRLELALSGDLSTVGDAIFRAILQQQGHECHGMAPRSPLERELVQMVSL